MVYIYRICKYKVKEIPGWNDEILRWCLNAAEESGLKPGDYLGGFAIDKMKIPVNFRKFGRHTTLTKGIQHNTHV